MELRKLTGLRPQTYEHPLDAQTLNLLENTTGLDTVVRKCNEWGFERILRVQLTGSHLRVTADNFPDIHDMVTKACEVLDLPVRPEVYIAAGGDINAFTAGVERTLVVLNAGAIDHLSDDELFFVIAHELGHIKSGHILYYQIAEFLPVIGEIVGAATFGIGELLGAGLQMALLKWKRMSELTADRAGLLACQDANVAITAMMKIAGLPSKYYASMNPEDFIAQAREFTSLDLEKLNWFAKWLGTVGQSHPWTVLRASEFLSWIDSGGYENALSFPMGTIVPPQLTGARVFCTQCGCALRGDEKFCSRCGAATAKPVVTPLAQNGPQNGPQLQ
ncbi:MAG TPA: M48 family metallopeptidase [Thermoanaerobaculia bacterium]|nr:M48 family metallopeptidase [Thermoanaerobaculia bacterium]